MAEQKKEEQQAPGSSSAPQKQPQKDVPNLGALDEDDEFEEFEAQGMYENTRLDSLPYP